MQAKTVIGVSVNVPGRGVVLLIVCTAATQHNASCRTYSTCCDIVESVLASTRTADLQFSKCTMLAGQLICCSANGTMLASTQTADLQLSKYTVLASTQRADLPLSKYTVSAGIDRDS